MNTFLIENSPLRRVGVIFYAMLILIIVLPFILLFSAVKNFSKFLFITVRMFYFALRDIWNDVNPVSLFIGCWCVWQGKVYNPVFKK